MMRGSFSASFFAVLSPLPAFFESRCIFVFSVSWNDALGRGLRRVFLGLVTVEEGVGVPDGVDCVESEEPDAES